MKVFAAPLISVATLLLLPTPSGAHTDSDTVAVPAGGEATVTFRPTHGCAGEPTIEVSVRAPVEGATAGAVDGWQQSTEPDGEGNTVLKWSGGLLAADQAGAFPITFAAPDAVGELLTFPAVQMCEGDKELAWIDGDPEGEYPAPRLLILAAGSESAATIDEVAADAPGRDRLGEIVAVDNPAEGEPATPTPEAAEPPTSLPASPSTTPPLADDEAASPTTGATSSDDDGGSSGVSVAALLIVGLGAVGVAVYMILRRRSQAS
ncbi:DUF1775 domain-containing protein [Iamia sp. SCSIO 61187]|uniref:DUF1775 domain-containing protein n=1 Tax=Iamia sp. SCSIO 61187 TaxID=2722752 RepID=UPI001C629F26|nr:DUF1775 domain-containing protein [Iamia sp. SCSIO 61187]QYG94344.1 DUF1775 domain-containing protein [Iamia sp. SCSIO 61187]